LRSGRVLWCVKGVDKTCPTVLGNFLIILFLLSENIKKAQKKY
jgi:hypothetical protein